MAAKPGGPEDSDPKDPEGIKELIDILCQNTFLPRRDGSGPFIFSVDHCFPIKGQGTVMTGTVLEGTVKLNDVSYLYFVIDAMGMVCWSSRIPYYLHKSIQVIVVQ